MNDFVPHWEAQSLRRCCSLTLRSAESSHTYSTDRPTKVCYFPQFYFSEPLVPNKTSLMGKTTCLAVKAKSHPYYKIVLLYPEDLQNP